MCVCKAYSGYMRKWWLKVIQLFGECMLHGMFAWKCCPAARLAVDPIAPAADTPGAFFVALQGCFPPPEHRAAAGPDVPDQRLQATGLTFGRTAEAVRFLRDDVEIVHDVGRWWNAKRLQIVQRKHAGGGSRRVADSAVSRKPLVGTGRPTAQPRMVPGTGASRLQLCVLLLLDGGQLAAQQTILFLQLFYETSFGFSLCYNRLRHALVDGGQEVVQRDEQRVLPLFREANGKRCMLLGVFAKWEN